MPTDQRHEEFVRLLAAHQGRIYAYVAALVFDWNATEELVQDTCVVLWQKFDTFAPGTDFASWACRVAHLNVLKWRQKQARSKEVYDDMFLQTVAQQQEDMSEEFDLRRQALTNCVQHLRNEDRNLLQQRYSRDRSAKEVALELGRPAASIHQSLHRIRRALLACIRGRLAREEVQ